MDTGDSLKDILVAHKLRVTDCRKDVLQLFLDQRAALSQGDLEHRLKNYDRVTLYRTLNSFLDSGILHKIPNSKGIATFGLCHTTCSPDQHDHDHIHFKCNHCGEILCLEENLVPKVSVPKGYHIENINLIVDGVCAECG